MTSLDVDRRLAALLVSSPHNLVSSQASRSQILSRHIAEARLVAESLGEVTGRWMDLGTGGGLPGLILAHRHPQAEWVLVDARGKKVHEVKRFAAELGISCRVAAGRAEELAWEPGWRETFDGVVTRALAPLRTGVELARGFLTEGGRMLAVKGASVEAEVEAAGVALKQTGMEVESVARLVGETHVVTMRASGGAPDGVPRRAGVPHRRPW